MGIIRDSIGYKTARNLAKLILLVSAVSISTFATTEFIANFLNFDFGLSVRDYVALSLIILAFLIKDFVINPPSFFDKEISKIVYYVILGFIAIAISTLNFEFITKILDTTFLDFPLLAVKNIVALVLLISIRNIHNAG